MTTLPILSLLLSLFLLTNLSSAQDLTTAFNFHSYFQGNWSISSTAIAGDTFEHFGVSDITTFYSIHAVQDSHENILYGTAFDNDSSTFQLSNRKSIQVEFSEKNLNLGTLKMSAGDSSDFELEELFEFDFGSLGSSHYSFGRWKPSGGVYQFLVKSDDSFAITIFGESGESMHLFSGERVKGVREKTFWQSYGSSITIGCVFLFNMFVQRRFRSDSGSPSSGTKVQTTVAEKALKKKE